MHSVVENRKGVMDFPWSVGAPSPSCPPSHPCPQEGFGWVGPSEDFHDVENSSLPVSRTLRGALAPRSPLRYFAGPE